MKEYIYEKKRYISFPKINIYYIFIFVASILWCISYFLIEKINPIKINTKDNIMNRISFEIHSISISQILFIIIYFVNLYLSKTEKNNFKDKKQYMQNEENLKTENSKISNILIQSKTSNISNINLIGFKTALIIFILSIFNIIYLYTLIVMRIKNYGNIDKIFLVGIFNFIIGTIIEKYYYKKILGLHRIIPFIYFSVMIPVYIYTIEKSNQFQKYEPIFIGKYRINQILEYCIFFIGFFLMFIKNQFYHHLTNFKYINPFFIIFLNGIFTLIIAIIFFYYLGYSFKFELLINNIFQYNLYIIILFLYFIFQTLSNIYISPTSCGLIFLFINLFISLIEKTHIYLFGIIDLNKFWIIPLFLPTIIMSILYCEFIVFHFCGLDEQTKFAIEERGKIEENNSKKTISSINFSLDSIK